MNTFDTKLASYARKVDLLLKLAVEFNTSDGGNNEFNFEYKDELIRLKQESDKLQDAIDTELSSVVTRKEY